MERLTERNPSWIDDEMWERACEPDCEEIDAVYRKLKAYEDADEQGLLLWLPCGIGTTVYEIENNTDACFECSYFVNAYCGDCEDFCSNKDVRCNNGDRYSHPQYADKPLCQKHFYEIEEYAMNNIDMIFNRRNDFGKTVFLSREQAEAKLAEMEGAE